VLLHLQQKVSEAHVPNVELVHGSDVDARLTGDAVDIAPLSEGRPDDGCVCYTFRTIFAEMADVTAAVPLEIPNRALT
jgi:hypothetical protein